MGSVRGGSQLIPTSTPNGGETRRWYGL